MRYKVNFEWNDGTADSFNAENAADRDANIADMLKRGDFRAIRYCKLYADGDTGEDVIVKEA